MLRRQLPSNVSLFAFEAAARRLSFTRAAAELNVTQPAISAAVAKLERFLAVPLFERKGARLELTEAGFRLYRAVSNGFERIEAEISEIQAQRTQKEPVILSISSAMTAHWLVPRLPEFESRFPHVELRFSLIPGEPAGPVDDFDLAVRLDSMLHGNVDACPFVDEKIYAVCAPSYLAQYGPLGKGRAHTFISMTLQRISWKEFMERLNIEPCIDARTLVFSDYAIVIHAAAAGQGVAMGWVSVVSHLLASGMMVTALPLAMSTGRQYWLATPKAKATRSVTREVRNWMIDQMGKDVAAVETVCAS